MRPSQAEAGEQENYNPVKNAYAALWSEYDDGPVIPIVIDLHIVGSQRVKLQKTPEEFCDFVKKTLQNSLPQPWNRSVLICFPLTTASGPTYWRHNDAADDGHGLAGRRIYEESRHDAVTAFLIEFHCRKDEEEYRHLQASSIKAKQRAWLPYQILKDVDALDWVRFGIYSHFP